MKIATFNINDINRRLANLLEWLRAAEPDVVCLQELKAADAGFPEAALRDAGYGAVWRGQRTWNGVVILAEDAAPILIRDELPGDPEDTHPCLVADLEAHQRPIEATSCDFAKACSAEGRSDPVIERTRRTVGAGVDRASVEHPCPILARPIDSACEKRRRDPLPATTSSGHEAGDTPDPRVVDRSPGRRRGQATRAVPARHIGARTDLHPPDGSSVPIREQAGRRACLDARPEQLPRPGPHRRFEVAPRHPPVHAPAPAAYAAPIAKHGFQICPPGRRQRSDPDLWRG
jgi:Endonuclease/Exonuclease/phosphatase family